MTNLEKIIKIAELNGGTITTEQINKMNIHRSLLSYLINKGLLERSARGVYILPNQFDDEFYNLHTRFKKGIFSNCTSLYLLGFTDRTPIKFDMTFPASYNTSYIKDEINSHRVKKELYEMGVIFVKTPFGNSVSTYCIERTLCDILQTRNAIDIQIITDAYKRYSKYNQKNIPLLSEYAKLLHVETKVRPYLEVLI